MSSSKRPWQPRQIPPPPGSKAGSILSRFIPREELQNFANWQPGSLGGEPEPTHEENVAAAEAEAEAAEPTTEEWLAEVRDARHMGYQDGYRDGLVALENFKQSYVQQMGGQFDQLLQAFEQQMGALEQNIAQTVAKVATQLAKQVVRHELATRPELVAHVAQEAVQAVLMSAKQIVVYLNPADHALVTSAADEHLAARGARLVNQSEIERGGCLIETDAGTVDARVAARWHDAVQSLGTDVAWDDGEEQAQEAQASHQPASSHATSHAPSHAPSHDHTPPQAAMARPAIDLADDAFDLAVDADPATDPDLEPPP